VAAAFHVRVDAGVVLAVVGGTAVEILAIRIVDAAARACCEVLAEPIDAQVFSALVCVLTLCVCSAADQSGDSLVHAGERFAAIQGAGKSVLALEISDTAVGIAGGVVLASILGVAEVFGTRVAVVAVFCFVRATSGREAAIGRAGVVVGTIHHVIKTSEGRVAGLQGAGVLVVAAHRFVSAASIRRQTGIGSAGIVIGAVFGQIDAAVSFFALVNCAGVEIVAVRVGVARRGRSSLVRRIHDFREGLVAFQVEGRCVGLFLGFLGLRHRVAVRGSYSILHLHIGDVFRPIRRRTATCCGQEKTSRNQQ